MEIKIRCFKKKIELFKAGEDPDHNKDLKDFNYARDVAQQCLLIRMAESRNNTELAAQLKMELEKLPGYEDYIISSKSGTTGPQKLSSTHVTEHPRVKNTPEGEIEEGKGSIWAMYQ